MIKTASQILSILTITADVLIIGIILVFLASKLLKKNWFLMLKEKVTPYSFYGVFAISLVSMLGSLFYSEVAHYSPCVLCWYQRIAMYPQAFLSYLAIIRNEKVLRPYLLLMNTVGAIIALYHYVIMRLPNLEIINCTVGGAVSCTKNYELYFSFVTIPFMALSAFVLNIVILSFFKESSVKVAKKKQIVN